jgi:hypothetical protein
MAAKVKGSDVRGVEAKPARHRGFPEAWLAGDPEHTRSSAIGQPVSNSIENPLPACKPGRMFLQFGIERERFEVPYKPAVNTFEVQRVVFERIQQLPELELIPLLSLLKR